MRGGSWFISDSEEYVRVAFRLAGQPDDWGEYIGFRCVRPE
jgi:formylglycine-generating enzyme required for sulfatase activity